MAKSNPKDNPHSGHRERVKQRFLNEGLDSFEDHQILELLLFYCIPMKDTNELAHNLIRQFGSLANVFEAEIGDLMEKAGVSRNTAVMLRMIPDLSSRYLRSKWGKNVVLDSTKSAGAYALTLFAGKSVECFYVICLDAQRRMIRSELVAEGTVDEAPIYIREIIKSAVRFNAVYVVIAHNHPGGSVKPSGSDIEATKAIISSFDLVKIEVTDHIIVAGDSYYSFAAKGLLGLGF